MKKPIHQFSLGYAVLRRHVMWCARIFYKKSVFIGLENIPRNKPIIFATNHQNALMDALNVLLNIKTQPVFMARSDIFKNPTTAKILRFLKIQPIYRIRDGIKNLQNNDAVFEESIAVLSDKKALGILPEGNHFGHRRLRSLKKGIARIAFKAEERHNFELDLQIVPVGIDYSHYVNFGSKLLVQFGKPFTLKKYKEEYLENDQKGMTSFMNDLRSQMLPLILNIDDAEHYDGIKAAIDIYIDYLSNNNKSLDNQLEIRIKMQNISDNIIAIKTQQPEEFTELTTKAESVINAAKTLNLRSWVLLKKQYNILGIFVNRLLQVLLFPFYLYGYTTNILPFQLPVFLSKNVKDEQFLSSFRFVLAVLTFTLFYLIYLILLLIFVSNSLLALALFVSIPIAGILSFKYYVWYKKTSARYRNNRYKAKNNNIWLQMHKNRDYIIELLNKHLSNK